jgi:hypothetical protein
MGSAQGGMYKVSRDFYNALAQFTDVDLIMISYYISGLLF